jgi:hypothetical protein
LVLLILIVCAVSAPTLALALDKQGSAHGGAVDGAEEGFNVGGAVSWGVSLYNPQYAARPDNTGLALFRYAAHADVDLIGRHLSIPLDINMFTDRMRSGAKKLGPTELDLIGGLTTTWRLGPGALEVGARGEHDLPLDRGGLNQTYADVRARYLYAVADSFPNVARYLADGNVTSALTLGWFAINPTYAARPDNTGLALFRYAGHVEISTWHGHLALGLDGTMFTDRRANPVRPTELDFTLELIGRIPPFELHLASERDMPLDQGTYVQSFIYLLASWSFDHSFQREAERHPPP